MSNPKAFLEMLVEAVQALALDASEQEELFPNFVVVADELALNFDQPYRLIDQIAKAGLLSEPQVEHLTSIQRDFDRMSLHPEPDLWTLGALRDRNEWQDIRSKARAALEALGADRKKPTMQGIVYIEGHREKPK